MSDVLDSVTLARLVLAITPVELEPDHKDTLLTKVFEKIHADVKEISTPDFLTIRADEGVWTALTLLVEMKLLYIDKSTESRSFLVRLQPNGSLPAHDHSTNEECMVLEGEVSLGGIQAKAGDYHLAPKGLRHGIISSQTGALLFVRTGLTQHAA